MLRIVDKSVSLLLVKIDCVEFFIVELESQINFAKIVSLKFQKARDSKGSQREVVFKGKRNGLLLQPVPWLTPYGKVISLEMFGP